MSALRLYNTLSKRLEDFRPRDPAHITFYSCGPTVYDDAHIGNFRSFLAADVLRRFLESPWCGLKSPGGERSVTHVMNITDVGHMTDDAEGGEQGMDRMAVAGQRMLEAKKAGKLPEGAGVDPSNPYDIARFYADRFLEDARTLGLKVALEQQDDPTLMPRATASIPGMIAVIQRLIERGHAYAVGEPGRQTVYFHVPSFPAYGRLSGNTLEALASGAGGRVNESNQAQKKHPADFLLWKADPSHIMKWDSPWGAGYPGWHIECTAMAAERLAGGVEEALERLSTESSLIDVHSGGEDNIFPHHESEIAQSSCAFCAQANEGTFARMWFHPRHLFVNGAKMSKSKGNFYTIRDLIAKGYEPGAIRLELIRTHYRSQANFTEQGLQDCARMIERWRKVFDAAKTLADERPRSGGPAAPHTDHRTASGLIFQISPRAMAFVQRCAELLNDDLNTAACVAEINTFVSGTSTPEIGDYAAMVAIDRVLGVLDRPRLATASTDIAHYAAGVEPSPEVEGLLRERRDARARKDFAASDRIRDQLASMGYAIKDVAGGRVEVRRSS